MLRFLIRGAVGIGMNVITFFSCAFLGFPGILLVYGLYFVQMYV